MQITRQRRRMEICVLDVLQRTSNFSENGIQNHRNIREMLLSKWMKCNSPNENAHRHARTDDRLEWPSTSETKLSVFFFLCVPQGKGMRKCFVCLCQCALFPNVPMKKMVVVLIDYSIKIVCLPFSKASMSQKWKMPKK